MCIRKRGKKGYSYGKGNVVKTKATAKKQAAAAHAKKRKKAKK